jgi:hypothetical protein
MPRRRRRNHNDADVERSRSRAELRSHIRKLGLQTEAEYQRWCRARGIGDGLQKSKSQKRKEREVASRRQGEAILSLKRGHTRSPGSTIRRLYDRSLPKGRLGAAYLYKVRSHFARLEADPPSRRAFLDLLLRVERHGKLFGPEPALPHLGELPGNTFVDGLAGFARHHASWVRPVDEWEPDSHNSRRQFGHLARHLLARYPQVPAFLDAAWFVDDDKALRQQQTWFLHLGAGGNIRTAPDLPVQLTKAMAHEFLQAEGNFRVEQALRWSQVIGQGGNATLARAILGTRLGGSFEHEDFWSSVVIFFVRNPMLDPEQVLPIVDYIHSQKFVHSEIVHPGGHVEQGPPPQPNFAMKSRSVDKLLRQVEEWHDELAGRVIVDPAGDGQGAPSSASKRRNKLVNWERSAIGGLDYEEVNFHTGERTHWAIRELCSNAELSSEGRTLHHCVLSYAKSCRNGGTTIWSLSARNGGSREPLLTIAANPHARAVTQVRGKYNAQPGGGGPRRKRGGPGRGYTRMLDRARPVMERWMRQEGLRMAR